MNRNIILTLVPTAMLAILPTAAVAQPDRAGLSSSSSITIDAPSKQRTGIDPFTGAPIDTLTASSTIYDGDLDLATPSGRDRLDHRVAVAAQDTCHWLDRVYPAAPGSSLTTNGQCVREAIYGTSNQVHAAITDYR